MLQNPRKTLGFTKNMVYKITPGGGEVNHIQPVAYVQLSPIHMQGCRKMTSKLAKLPQEKEKCRTVAAELPCVTCANFSQDFFLRQP